MSETLGYLLAGFGLCYSGGVLLGNHLKNIAGSGFRNLVYRGAQNQWIAGLWGLGLNVVIGRASILAMVIGSLISANLINLSQAFPMIVWGNVGGVLIIYLAAINIKVFVLYFIGLGGIAYAFGKKSRCRNLIGSLFSVGMLIFGVTLVKDSAQGAFDVQWLQDLFGLIRDRLWVAFLLGCFLKVITQSGFVLALLEISLAQAGVIDLPQVIAIFLGSRLSTSVLSWVLSATSSGAAKHLMMVQVFYNVMGSGVFLIALYAEEWLGLPLVQFGLAQISENIAVQVASMALIYCGVTSLAMTLVKWPLLRFIDRTWPATDEVDPFETKYINEQSLNDPETAMDLANKEQNDLMNRLLDFMLEMRQAMNESKPSASIGSQHDAFRSVAKKINAFLIDLGNQNLSTDSFNRFLNILNRQGILVSLESQVLRIAGNTEYLTGSSELKKMVIRFMEALDFILMAAVDACVNREQSDIELLKTITSDKSSQMEMIRDAYLSGESTFGEVEKALLFEATIRFEKTVWLVHLLAESLNSSFSDATAK